MAKGKIVFLWQGNENDTRCDANIMSRGYGASIFGSVLLVKIYLFEFDAYAVLLI